ncbi:MAG: hypothetical protein WC756_12205 [Taibaiella sp.]|jgi:hypothetical protein
MSISEILKLAQEKDLERAKAQNDRSVADEIAKTEFTTQAIEAFEKIVKPALSSAIQQFKQEGIDAGHIATVQPKKYEGEIRLEGLSFRYKTLSVQIDIVATDKSKSIKGFIYSNEKVPFYELRGERSYTVKELTKEVLDTYIEWVLKSAINFIDKTKL